MLQTVLSAIVVPESALVNTPDSQSAILSLFLTAHATWPRVLCASEARKVMRVMLMMLSQEMDLIYQMVEQNLAMHEVRPLMACTR